MQFLKSSIKPRSTLKKKHHNLDAHTPSTKGRKLSLLSEINILVTLQQQCPEAIIYTWLCDSSEPFYFIKIIEKNFQAGIASSSLKYLNKTSEQVTLEKWNGINTGCIGVCAKLHLMSLGKWALLHFPSHFCNKNPPRSFTKEFI